MSRERDIVMVNTPSLSESVSEPEQFDASPIDESEMSEEERAGRAKIAAFMALSEDERKALRADILDRGVLFDTLHVDLPDDLYGEWERDDPMAIEHKRSLGFWVDETYAARRALHSDGSGANRVGDVIHMVTMKANKELIDSVKRDRILREQRDPRRAREESTVGLPQEIPAFSESKVHSISAADLHDAATRAAKQTQIQR